MRIPSLGLLLLAGSVACTVPDKFLSDAGGGDEEATLTITTSGDSTGTVTSSPDGIDCGSTCSMTVPVGTTITLTATPDADTTFDGWSGGGCSGTSTCEITLDGDTTIDAAFNVEQYTLTITKTGSGTGDVTSGDGGIDCGGDCSEVYDPGAVVTLTATPIGDSIFAGWSGGGCSGTGTCVVTIDAAVEVNAGFALNPYTLTVTTSGTGSGSVTSSPVGIDCGLDCDEMYDSGTDVTLTATPTEGRFSGWNGGGCTGTDPCTVDLTADTSVDAAFTRITVTNVTSSTVNGGYGVGAAISIQVTFSDPVTVSGAPQLGLNSSGIATYSSGSGTNTLTFTYTVAAGNASADLDYIAASSLTLPGGATITGAEGGNATLTLPNPGAAGSLGANKALVIDGFAPVVNSLNSPTVNGTYTTNSAIAVQVIFGEAVLVTGTPRLTLNTGAVVNYSSGSGSNTLVFNYTVAAGHNTPDLTQNSTTALALNGGTIRDGVGNNAVLTLPAPTAAGSLAANKALVIDTVAPVTKWSEGTNAWPDQACNPTNSFGGCNTNAIEHANAWASHICRANGFGHGTWTGLKNAGCAGAISMYCGGAIPCSPLVETTCFASDQTMIQFTCLAPTTWDTSWSVPGITYTNGNLSISGNSAGTTNARATVGKSTGKWYWEIRATGGDGTTNAGGLGIMESATPNTTGYIGSEPSGVSIGYGSCCATTYWINWSGTSVNGTPPATSAVNTGNVYMFALDMDAKRVWFGMNGVWFNSGNPGAGTNAAVTGLTGTVYPGVTFYPSSINAFTANFGGQAFSYPVPTGFNAGIF